MEGAYNIINIFAMNIVKDLELNFILGLIFRRLLLMSPSPFASVSPLLLGYF